MSFLLFPGKVPWKKPPEKSSNQLDQWFDALFPLFLGGPFRWILTADKNFLDEETRLTAFPAKKTAALIYLPSKLNPGTLYTEKELTAILTQRHTLGGPATLRREWYQTRFLDRGNSGERLFSELEPCFFKSTITPFF